MITRLSQKVASSKHNTPPVDTSPDKEQGPNSTSSQSPQSYELPTTRSGHINPANSDDRSIKPLASRQTEIPPEGEKEFRPLHGDQIAKFTFAYEFSNLHSTAFSDALKLAFEIAAARTDQQLFQQLQQFQQRQPLIEPSEKKQNSSSNQNLEALEESIFMAITSIENAATKVDEKLNHSDACAVTARALIHHTERLINNEYRLLIHPFIDLLSNEFEEAVRQVITNEGPDSPIANHCDALLSTSRLDRLNDPIYRRLIYEILERLNVATTARFMSNKRLSMEEAASIATRTIRKFFARELYKNNNVVINVNGEEVGYYNGLRTP